jgi:hypothetical protein
MGMAVSVAVRFYLPRRPTTTAGTGFLCSQISRDFDGLEKLGTFTCTGGARGGPAGAAAPPMPQLPKDIGIVRFRSQGF